MAGDGDNYEIDGDGQLNQPITRFHFNALRNHLRQEFRASLETVEEKQDKLSEDLQQLMGNVNDLLTQNLAAMQVDLVAQIVRELRQVPGDASVHGDERDDVNDETASRNTQGRRNQVASHRNNVAVGHQYDGRGYIRRNNGGDAAGRGRGRGRGRGNIDHDDFDDEYEDDDYGLHRNDGFCRRGNYGREQRDEERFGKLKFTMPKFDGGSDPKAYLTWELKVDKIFRMHNYSEEKKLAMASLEFEDYALIWWEQVQSQ
ncbi:unnamed protein product [Rhodiola kirilowii]